MASRTPRSARRPASVAARVFALQALAVLLIAGALLAVLVADARRSADDDAATASLQIARTIAADPRVQEAVQASDATTQLQPYTATLLERTSVDFVTIMDPAGIRLTHPNPAQIGKPFAGTIAPAQKGRELTETYTGTLGPSVRAVVPILDDGRVVGMVAVGVTTEHVGERVWSRLPFVAGIALAVVLVGTAGAFLLQRGLRRTTGGLPPAELSRMLTYYESVLHSVREGLLLTDEDRRVVLYNDEAAELLGLPPAAEARLPETPGRLGIEESVAGLLESGRRVVEESHVANGTVLLINQEPAVAPGGARAAGSVMTLRDQSVLQELVGELESTRTMSRTLRSQAHEHANAMHTVVSLLELGRVEAAIELASSATAASQSLADDLLGAPGSDPVLGALLLGKTAHAHERGVTLRVRAEPGVTLPLAPPAVVSVAGNLVDNAIEAALAGDAPRWVELDLGREHGDTVLTVRDSGPGIAEADRERVFELGVTGKSDAAGHGFGLAIVRDAVTAAGGTVAVEPGPASAVTVRFPASGGAP